MEPSKATLPGYLQKAFGHHPNVVKAKKIYLNLTKARHRCFKCIKSLAHCWVNNDDGVWARCAFLKFSSCNAGPTGPIFEGYRAQGQKNQDLGVGQETDSIAPNEYTALKIQLEIERQRGKTLENENKKMLSLLDAIGKGGEDEARYANDSKEASKGKRWRASTDSFSSDAPLPPKAKPEASTSKTPGTKRFKAPPIPTRLSPDTQHNLGALAPTPSLGRSQASVGIVLGSPISTSSSDVSPPPAEYRVQEAPAPIIIDLQSSLALETPAQIDAEAKEVAMPAETDLVLDRIERLEQGLRLVLDENMDLEKRVKKLEKKR